MSETESVYVIPDDDRLPIFEQVLNGTRPDRIFHDKWGPWWEAPCTLGDFRQATARLYAQSRMSLEDEAAVTLLYAVQRELELMRRQIVEPLIPLSREERRLNAPTLDIIVDSMMLVRERLLDVRRHRRLLFQVREAVRRSGAAEGY